MRGSFVPNIVMIGMGAVGRAFLELLDIENINIPITIIEPNIIDFKLAYKWPIIAQALNNDNLNYILTPLLKPNTTIIDRTVYI